MGKFIDITGGKFGRLKVIEKAYTDKNNFIRWKCICECGNIYYGRSYELRKGLVKSCGCLEKENLRNISGLKTHGLSKKPIYKVWKSMKARCYRKTDKRFKRYGGRGIIVCDEWINNPEKFIEWANSNGYRKGLTIDRIDNNGNYCPNNCRFVSIAENNRNSSNTHLSQDDILKIRELYKKGTRQINIALLFNITQQTVSKIVNNKTWK